MLESVACQGGVVDLNVDLEVLVEAMSLKEADNGLRVDVLLVL